MLLTPGPTPVPESIRNAMATPTIHHRTAEFETIFEEARRLLLKLLDMPECVMLSSSGTGAMEACVTNLCSKKAIVVNSGKFGERFGKICDAFGTDFVELKQPWDIPVALEDILDIVKNDKDIDAVFVQVCESAGGLRHPVEQIAQEVKKINKDIMIIADGITAVGVESIDTTNIDALITGSQKALMLPPGLSMIGFSLDAVEKINKNKIGYYFNLASEIKKQKQNTTAYTANTTLTIGLKAMLEKIEEFGTQNLYDITALRASASQLALQAIGLSIYPKNPAKAMSVIYSENASQIRNILKEKFDINVAGGQDHLKGKIFRINNMGFVENYEIVFVLNAIELALDELKIRDYDGTANTVFSNAFFKGKNK